MLNVLTEIADVLYQLFLSLFFLTGSIMFTVLTLGVGFVVYMTTRTIRSDKE